MHYRTSTESETTRDPGVVDTAAPDSRGSSAAFRPRFRSQAGGALVLAAYDSLQERWPKPFDERFVRTDVGVTHVLVNGPERAPPVFLLHGFYASALSWYRNVAELSQHHRVYSVDVIGEPNKSLCSTIMKDEAMYVRWLSDVMDALGVRSADLVGNSMGGFHCASFALGAPRRVRRLVLVAPAATVLQMWPFYLHFFVGSALGWEVLLRHGMRWIENGVATDPAWRSFFDLTLRHGKAATRVMPAVLSDAAMRSLATPTLLLVGDKEVIYNETDAALARASRLLPCVETQRVPNANHLAPLTQPELVNASILRFLE